MTERGVQPGAYPASRDRRDMPSAPPYDRQYVGGKVFAEVIYFLGIGLVIFGAFGALVVGLAASNRYESANWFWLLLPWGGIIVAGLIQAVAAQAAQATIDTANHTGEMLALMKHDLAQAASERR